jgi:hypothetical protein
MDQETNRAPMATWTGFALMVLVIALAVNFAMGVKQGIGKKVESDTLYFYHVARSLADGKGYVDQKGFWPTALSAQRLPGWPFAVSLTLRAFRGCPDDLVLRILCLAINAGVAVIVFAITARVFRRPSAAAVAGVAYALHPSGLHLAYSGDSEPLFLFLAGVGVLFLLARGRSLEWSRRLADPELPIGGMWWAACAGFLVLGLSVLVRANFVFWLFFAFTLAAAGGLRRGYRIQTHRLHVLAVAAVLFLSPPMLWMARNFVVCDHFPVISTLSGSPFYGGNNGIVATNMEYWGYWVFPGDLPGETPMWKLAETMSEYQVNQYWMTKGTAFIREHWFEMPRLWLGKVIRAFVPVPWKPSWGMYAVCAYRWMVYLGAAVGMWTAWRKTPVTYRTAVLAMAMTSILTILIFCGFQRYVFASEPFFLPFFGVGIVRLHDLIFPPRETLSAVT